MANSISSYILLYFFGNALIYFCDVTIICLSALLCFQGIWNYFITLLPKEKKKNPTNPALSHYHWSKICIFMKNGSKLSCIDHRTLSSISIIKFKNVVIFKYWCLPKVSAHAQGHCESWANSYTDLQSLSLSSQTSWVWVDWGLSTSFIFQNF